MQLLCIGDCAIADRKVQQSAWKPPGEMIPGDDMRILFNWELPIGNTLNPVPRSSGPRLLAHEHAPRALHRWSPGFATLATNHILDAGEEGLASTMNALGQAGFSTVGAGRTGQEITRPLFWETAEGRLAIVNWVFAETHPDWMAVPGPNCWPGLDAAGDIIGKVRSEADWVVVVPHWSDEDFAYPRPEDRLLARELAQMGVDLVIGHHPHVVRGKEMIGDCQVFYSLGNYYFSDFGDGLGGWTVRSAPRNREGLGVQVTFRRGEVPACRPLSFWQASGQSLPDPGQRAARRMRQVSHPLERFAEAEYGKWYAVQRTRFDRWGYRWHFRVRKLGIRGVAQYATRRISARWRSISPA